MPNGETFALSDVEKQRMQAGLRAAFSSPLLDDVEDFVWEAIFHYVKGIELYDPYTRGRTKELFDVVAPDGRGWSLKTLLRNNHTPGTPFEFIIQRADIFKKAKQLGFSKGLTAKSSPATLGAALIRHWNEKIIKDKKAQSVHQSREGILLKSKDRKRFAYVESALECLNEADYIWRWSSGKDQRGLQGSRNGAVQFKWYHGQKQLFEVQTIPENAYTFTLEWDRLSLADFMAAALPRSRTVRASKAKD